MKILGIDPGTVQSGWAIFDTATKDVIDSGVVDNELLAADLDNYDCDHIAIEVFEARGMPIGEDSIKTILFTGRIMQIAFQQFSVSRVISVRRSAVKLHLCGSPKAKDANIRQALIDLLGPPGKKSVPGPTYGVTSHGWAALAVAVTASADLDAARRG